MISSSDLLKIFVKMGAIWSAQDFRQAGVTPSGPVAFFLFCFWKTWRTYGAFPLHGTARYGTVRFTFGGFSTGYCT